MNLITKLKNCKLEKNQLALVWLGQAGFVIADSNGKTIAIDPYISHCGEKIKNFVRMSPILVKAEEMDVDAYLVTHRHFDHFDYDSIPLVAKHTDAEFYGPISCVKEFEQFDIPGKKMTTLKEENPAVQITKDIEVKAVYADHGEMEPDAIGMWLSIGPFKIYVTGDTAYRPEKLNGLMNAQPDLMIASVNGELGNLNAEEGAKLAGEVGAKNLIPCHFWTFVEHKGSPEKLRDTIVDYAQDTQLHFLTAGDIYIYEKQTNGDSELYRFGERN